MNNALNPNLIFLNGGQLLEVASALDAIHSRTIKAIDRLNADVAARKQAIASRWNGTASLGLPARDRSRIEAEEIRVALIEIRRNAEKELDGYFKDAGTAHTKAIAQREFYDSPVKTLNRLTLGDPKRSEYQRQLSAVGPAELGHLGQYAVSTGNIALAAAVVSRIDTLGVTSRPFGAAALAEAMKIDEHRKGAEAIKIADARFQGIVIAVRTWKSDKSNPLHTVSLALQERTLDEKLLSEMEADNGNAS